MMSTAQKILTPPVAGSSPSGKSSDGANLSQAEAFVLVASVLSHLNFISTKNRLDMIQEQGKINKNLNKLSETVNAENAAKFQKYLSDLNASHHKSWWEVLIHPQEWIPSLINTVFHININQLIAEKMDAAFKHLSPAERGIVKGLMMVASVMPGLCLVTMALAASGLLSAQTLLAAGEDPTTFAGKFATYFGMALDVVGQLAIAITTAVAITVATGGAGVEVAVAETVGTALALTEETIATITSLARIASIGTTVVEGGLNVGSSGFTIKRSLTSLEAAKILEEMAPLQELQRLLRSFTQFNSSAMQNIITDTRPFLDRLNGAIKGLKELLTPLAVTAAN